MLNDFFDYHDEEEEKKIESPKTTKKLLVDPVFEQEALLIGPPTLPAYPAAAAAYQPTGMYRRPTISKPIN